MKDVRPHPAEQGSLVGGIRRDVSPWIPGHGLWQCSGAHGNSTGAIQKWTGLLLENTLPVAAKIDGLYQLRLGGSYVYLAMAGGTIYKLIPSQLTGLPTVVKSGLIPHPFDVRVLNNVAYLVSSVNPNLKIDVNGLVTGMGIPGPPTAPTAAPGIAGALTGDYQFKYSFVNSVTGFESNPSPVSNTVTVLNQQIDLTDVAVSTDPQVDRRKVYRTTAGGAVYQFVGEIPDNITTTYTTNDLDATLAEEIREDAGVPPQASYIEVFNGMVLLTGLAAPNESRVVVSGVLRGEAFDPDNVYDLDPEETDIITGIKKFGLFVAVGKEKGMFVGEGTAPDQMTFTRTRVDQGPLGQWSMVSVLSDVFYLAEKGLHVFSGLNEIYLGRPIEAIYKTLDLSAIRTASGIHYPSLNMILWNVTTAGAGNPNLAIVYNLATKELTTRPLAAARLATYKDSLARTKMWVGGLDGNFYTGDSGYSEAGAPIAEDVITRGLTIKGARPEDVICFRHIHTHYKANGATAGGGGGSAASGPWGLLGFGPISSMSSSGGGGVGSGVTVSYCVDDPDGLYTVAGTFQPTTGARVTHDIKAFGTIIYLRYQVNSTEPFELYQPVVQGFVVGRRRA